MILERTITNGDTIKTALLDAERLKKRVTFYTRTRTMIDKFTCRDTENKPITLGRFTISGGLIYYKRNTYDWQTISLDDVLKIDISDPETAPEGTPASTPAAKSEPKRNRIPRKFTRLYITMLTDTTAGKAGTRATVYRNKYGELVEETESGELYAANLALLRTADLVRIDKIETDGPSPEETPARIPEESPAPVTATTSPATDENQESTTDAPTTPESAPEPSPALYKYGMRIRGYSIGAQPAGVAAREDDPTGIYYDVICYERELTPAEVDHYSLDPLQPAREPAQAASQDTRSTLPPGPEKDPETVTESTTASQEERPLTPQAKPRRGPTRPARTASHTSTHGRHKTPYKAKYKARRTHAAPPGNTHFSKIPYYVGLVSENEIKTICDTKRGQF